MIRFVPLFFLSSLLLFGCGKKDPPEVKQTSPQKEMMTPDPAAFVDMNFLSEQAVKRDALRKELDSLRSLPVIDRSKISALINRRKGELMTLKKNMRLSTSLSAAQRDSLIAPLELESIELAGDLIAVAK